MDASLRTHDIPCPVFGRISLPEKRKIMGFTKLVTSGGMLNSYGAMSDVAPWKVGKRMFFCPFRGIPILTMRVSKHVFNIRDYTLLFRQTLSFVNPRPPLYKVKVVC